MRRKLKTFDIANIALMLVFCAAMLHLQAELHGYDPILEHKQTYSAWLATYKAQKEVFWSARMGGSMGYGQGYNTQTTLLLDDVVEYSSCLNWAARFFYHHSEFPYIVPEGVTCHPYGRFWYRHTDLGNAVQQSEIIKCIRLVLGFDDLDPEKGLRLVPRLPMGWTGIDVRGYPVAVSQGNSVCHIKINMTYNRVDKGFELCFEAEQPVELYSIRFGPFDTDALYVESHNIVEPHELLTINGNIYAYLKPKGEYQT